MEVNNNQLVSIIVPVYNRENYIKQTVENIADSEYRPIELILVNDGSTDGSLNILEAFKAEYQSDNFFIKILTQVNQGAPTARNLGFENSNGEFIQFLDSDDFISPSKFTIQIKAMNDEYADFGLCDFEMVYPKEDKVVCHSNAKQLKKVIKTHGSFGCGSPLLRKSLADKINWNIELKRNQDVDYFLKAALLSLKMVYVKKTLYTYIRHDDERISASYSKTAPAYNIRIKSLIRIFKYRYNRYYIILAIYNLWLSMSRFKMKVLYEKTFL